MVSVTTARPVLKPVTSVTTDKTTLSSSDQVCVYGLRTSACNGCGSVAW